MRFSRSAEIISGRPILSVSAVFAVSTLLFVLSFIFFEYKAYLLNYKQTQSQEFSLLQEKVSNSFNQLHDLSRLTTKRIKASPQDLRRIQRVLGSLHQFFPDYIFPRIQKVAYHKISLPQASVTRLAIHPGSSLVSSLKELSEATSAVAVDNTSITSKTLVLDKNNRPQGILEIEIDLVDFKKSLGNYATLSLFPEPNSSLFQKSPVSVYGILPHTFAHFLVMHSPYSYGLFLVYMLLCLIFVPLAILVLNKQQQHRDREERNALQRKVTHLETSIQQQEEVLLSFQHTQTNQKISERHYQNLRESLSIRQKAGLDFIVKSLDVLKQSLDVPHMHISDTHQAEILQACYQESLPFSYGAIAEVSHEPLDIKDMLHKTRELFAAKIHEANLEVDILCPKTLIFKGDALFFRLLFTTLIGKPIYKALRGGRIEVRARVFKTALHIDIKDTNALSYSDKAEQLIKKSFDLFMTQKEFEQCCHERKLLYTYVTDDQGHNITKLVVPILKVAPGALTNNVVPLFS